MVICGGRDVVVLRCREGKTGMDGLLDGAAWVLEVPLRALWCKATGSGGRLRQAPLGEGRKRREDMVIDRCFIGDKIMCNRY
jgi:hypothetical protein